MLYYLNKAKNEEIEKSTKYINEIYDPKIKEMEKQIKKYRALCALSEEFTIKKGKNSKVHISMKEKK